MIDLDLGGAMDGIDLIEALRKTRPEARYALVTAAQEQIYKTRAEALGISVMRKPVSPYRLELWFGQGSAGMAAE